MRPTASRSGRTSFATIAGLAALLAIGGLAVAFVSLSPATLDDTVVRAKGLDNAEGLRSADDLAEVQARGAAQPGRRSASSTPRSSAAASIPNWPLVPIFGGRLVVIEPDGRRNHRASAMLDIATRSNDAWGHVRVPIVDGEWRLELATGEDGTLVDPQTRDVIGPANVDVHYQTMAPEMTDGGRPVVLVGDTSPTLSHGQFDIELRARRLTAAALVVVDAESDVELDDVVVLTVPTRSRELAGARHPGNARGFTELASGPSPIEVREDRARRRLGMQHLLVGAEGRAWQRIGLDLARGGERRVALERGGTLEISTEGDVPRGAAIRLWRDGLGAPYASLEPAMAVPVILKGVVPGAYTAALEVGRWQPGGPALDAKEVNVEAGRKARVTLVSEIPQAPATAPINGTVRVPAEWEPDAVRLKLVAVGTSPGTSVVRWASRRLPPSGGVGGDVDFAFDCGDQPVGPYRLEVETHPTAVEFELGVDGRKDLVVHVAPPVDITVETRDARTGERTAATHLTWRTRRIAGQRPFASSISVGRADLAAPFRVRVPRSEIELQVRDGVFISPPTRLVPVEGERVVLDVRRALRVRLILRDGETTIPWPTMETKRVERVDGAECAAWYDSDAEGAQVVRLHAPGRYRVEVPMADGYGPREPFEFEVGEGAPSDVFIDLEPAR